MLAENEETHDGFISRIQKPFVESGAYLFDRSTAVVTALAAQTNMSRTYQALLFGVFIIHYVKIFGLPFVLITLPLLLTREIGQCWAMRCEGHLKRKWYFVPFLGAYLSPSEPYRHRKTECFVTLVGLTCSSGTALAAHIGGMAFHSLWLTQAAAWIAFVSILNLLPILPLDGGRLLRCVGLSVRNGSLTVAALIFSMGTFTSLIWNFSLGLALLLVLLTTAFAFRIDRERAFTRYRKILIQAIAQAFNVPATGENATRILAAGNQCAILNVNPIPVGDKPTGIVSINLNHPWAVTKLYAESVATIVPMFIAETSRLPSPEEVHFNAAQWMLKDLFTRIEAAVPPDDRDFILPRVRHLPIEGFIKLLGETNLDELSARECGLITSTATLILATSASVLVGALKVLGHIR